MNLNLSFIKDMLMTPCYFDQKIILKNFDVTLIANITNIKFTSEIEQSIPYRFTILELEGLTIVFLQVFIAK